MEKKSWNIKGLRKALQLVRPYKREFILCTVMALILAPLSAAGPYLINVMTDSYVVVGDIDGLKTFALIYLAILILLVFFRYSFIYRTNVLGQNLIRDLRTRIFDHLSRLHLGYFDKTPVGQSTTRTINDTETINTMFSQGLIPMMADVLTLIAFVIAMIYTNVKLTLISFMVIPFLIVASIIFTRNVKKAYRKLRAELAKMNAFLQERITGMSVIQIFNAEDQEMRNFKAINRAYTQENINNIFYYAIFLPIVEIVSATALAIMVWWGARDVVTGHMELGDLVAFPLYLSGMFRPIRMLADKFNHLQLGIVATDRVFSALGVESIIEDKGGQVAQKLYGKIEFENVDFSYVINQPILKNISFNIEPGQSLALVGSTGSGKTTIINLLSRLYDINDGHIKIDGVDIKDYKLNALRRRMAVVLQDVFLFRGTLFENITLMEEGITKQQVIEAAKMIGAHEFFERLPEEYDFLVTERGSNLSMGQRQLVSFVRALVFDPDILILDEATSSIDVETEAVIQYAIEKLIAQRTSIIIAHRLSTVRHANKILVMERGEVAQQGNHETLIKDKAGLYYGLNQMQLKTVITSE